MQETGLKFSPEYVRLSEGQFYQFSQSTKCHTLIFALVCYRSGTAAAGDLILIELDGG